MNETQNGVRLHHQLAGSGEEALIAIHGSWSEHGTWSFVVPMLLERFRVVTYDRRGHGVSEAPPGQGSVHDDVADVAGLIERLDLAPAWVVGNSFGGLIALRLAGARPDLVRGVIAHEPPATALLSDRPQFAPMMREVESRLAAVLELLRSGNHAAAAERFVETVALGPGSWERLPSDARVRFIANAQTFLDESDDPDASTIDLDALARFPGPVFLTLGDQSPPMFAPIARLIADAVSQAQISTFAGAGHVPHLTHPEALAETVTSFIAKNEG